MATVLAAEKCRRPQIAGHRRGIDEGDREVLAEGVVHRVGIADRDSDHHGAGGIRSGIEIERAGIAAGSHLKVEAEDPCGVAAAGRKADATAIVFSGT